MAAPDPPTFLALRAVAIDYAAGLDRRDAERFVAAFHDDGQLRIHHPASSPEPQSVRRGHAELAQVTEVIQRYEQTCHFLGQSSFDVVDDEASGETYCTAHHLAAGPHGGETYVMHIRYEEHLRRGDDGIWRFVDRAVLIDWTDRHLAGVVGQL